MSEKRAPELNIRQLSSDLAQVPIQLHKAGGADATLDLAPGAWVDFENLVVRGYAMGELQIFGNADNQTIGFSIVTWGECRGSNYDKGPQGRVRYQGTIVTGVAAKAGTNPITGEADGDDSWHDAESAPAATYPLGGTSPVSVVPILANQVALFPVSFALDLFGVHALVVHFHTVPGKAMAGLQLGF